MAEESDSEIVVEVVEPKPPSLRSVLLGLFILFQLAFLVVTNLLGMIQWIPTESGEKPKTLMNRLVPQFGDQAGHVWTWSEVLETNTRRWTQLTYQDQEWSLFAPSVGKATGFPAILLVWDEEPPLGASITEMSLEFDPKMGFHWMHDRPLVRIDELRSVNEPADVNDYVRIGKCRVRRYEGQFYFDPQTDVDHGETEAALATRMNERMRRFVREYHDATWRYLQWRLNAWHRENPERVQPKQVILIERFYRIRGTEEARGWEGPTEVPMVRWRPDVNPAADQFQLEPFDFHEHRFRPMGRHD